MPAAQSPSRRTRPDATQWLGLVAVAMMLGSFAYVMRCNQPRRTAAPSPQIATTTATYATVGTVGQLQTLCTYDFPFSEDVSHVIRAVEPLVETHNRARDFVEEELIPSARRLQAKRTDCDLIDALGTALAGASALMQNVSSMSRQVSDYAAVAAVALRRDARAAKATVHADAQTKNPLFRKRPKDRASLAEHRLRARTLQGHEATLGNFEQEMRARRVREEAFERWLGDHRKLVKVWKGKGQVPGRCLAAGAELFMGALRHATRGALVPWS